MLSNFKYWNVITKLFFYFAVIPDTPYITHIGFKNTFVAVDLQWNTTDYSAHLRPSVRLRVPNGSWVN